MAGFVLQDQARVYAEQVQQGHSLVAVRAGFGYGQLATQILGREGPLDTGLEARPPSDIAWDEGAPLSCGLKLPVLLRDKPSPISNLIGLSPLGSGLTFGGPKYKELSDANYTFSSKLGLPLISRNQLSKTKLTGKSGASWTSSWGLPMLSRNPAPLSSMLGLEVSTGPLPPHEPAPFSARIGFPTLSHGRSMLSRLFGEIGSSKFALFGRNPLISSPAPASKLFGLPTLKDSETPYRPTVPQPLLVEDGAGLSSKLGLPLLTKGPGHLSSLFGLPLLTRHQ
jgi:hypothetical protein